MTRVIVTTTINEPTPALEAYAALPDWHVIVVLDKKSKPFSLSGVEVLTPRDQDLLDKDLSDAIGWNCIQRRNMGYLHAYRSGADVVASVDDDNIPLDGWGEDVRVGKLTPCTVFDALNPDTRAFDPLAVASAPHLWHRGFPLSDLTRRAYEARPELEEITPDVEASLWVGDPDIDAICRLEHAPYLESLSGPTPFAGAISGPFNSQNTFLGRSVLPEYFCFTGVGRFDDIWASYHVQALGAAVVYTAASVVQERNAHDLMVDLEKEMLGYVQTPPLLDALRSDANAVERFLPAASLRAFNRYRFLMRAAQEVLQ